MIDRIVSVGNLKLGKGQSVTIQSMYDRPLTDDIDSIIGELVDLKAMGCDLFRFTFFDEADEPRFKEIIKRSPMPLVADIHFDYKKAIKALVLGFDAVRINPGNIGSKEKTLEVVRCAKEKGKAIRIGLNSGSLPKNEMGKTTPQLMVDTALEYLSWFEDEGFYNTVVSLKSSSPDETYEAAKLFAQKSGYPQHLGVTEAGSVISSAVRSTWTLGRLLEQGIGATIRYSINGAIEQEVYAAVELLRTLGLRKGGVRIVACPRCGRYKFDSYGFLKQVEPQLLKSNKDVCVAFMGCQVNGPGEAKNADLAVAGVGNSIFLYKKGELYKQVEQEEAIKTFWDAFNSL